MLWHFTTDENGQVNIYCETAVVSELETFIAHVLEGVEMQAEIAEMMGKPKGTVSKWVKKAVAEGRIKRDGNRLLPPAPSPRQQHRAEVDD